MIDINGYKFETRAFSAYDSLKTLGKISKLLAPMMGSIDLKKVLAAKEKFNAGEDPDLSFLSFLGEMDEDLLMEVADALVSRATHNDVPVSLRDTAWKGKTVILLKLAYEIALEEYSDFLQELGLGGKPEPQSQDGPLKRDST